MSTNESAKQRAQRQRQEAYRATQERAAARNLQMQERAMARGLAEAVNQRGTRQARLIQSQLNPQMVGQATAPTALTKDERLATRQSIYGVDQRARQLSQNPGQRPLGDLQVRAGEAQGLFLAVQGMDKVAANLGITDYAAQTEQRIQQARERTTDAVKRGATELEQSEVMQTQVAKAFALMNAGDGLAAFSFRSADAEAAELAELADRVPMDLVEKVTASAGLQNSPARAAIIQRAVAAEMLARHAQQVQAQQQTQEQAGPTAGALALETATFGLLVADSRDSAVDELAGEAADGIGKALGLAVAAPALILEQSLEVVINK